MNQKIVNILPKITNGTASVGGSAGLNNLLISKFHNIIILEGNMMLNLEIAGNIHKLEQGLKQHNLNNTLNSINNAISADLVKGMLGYVSKHTLTDFKTPKNLEKNVLEYRNNSDLEIDSKNSTEKNSTSLNEFKF
ncbi:uncharacterized protein ELE39_002688 [Cryptosporidium sp. chipmunk genotype I]|uniref:uncharacterized protein n=1 Tax=Cryptosporidium sp. chipmunk genotype I TaxID=1280935 RepID=UPI003519DB93|nr:hypothetical protein ELE39_002688 [Cryptosporidium sp. chipmunk genotype I]